MQAFGEVFASLRDPETGTSWVVVGANWAEFDSEFIDGELTSVAYCAPAPEASAAPYAERHAAAVRYAKSLATRMAAAKRR